ncbi:MAG TPA: DUF1684 domain-containing protein [Candidatus Angelobacter sp.]|jgi:hypothetical protein
MISFSRTVFVSSVFALFLCLSAADGSSYQKSSYQQTIEKWRQDFETSLKGDDDWLTVAGLFWLHEGENSFGSAPGNAIVLPAPVPAQAGHFDLHAGKITVHINPGAPITQGGKAVESAEMHPDVPEERLVCGEVSFYVHASSGRFAIRLKDKNSRLRKEFKGLHWYPVNEAYRFNAHYVAYPKPRSEQIGIVHGGHAETSFDGYVTFSLGGKEYKLDTNNDAAGNLFIVFRDLTSKTETYQAARFIDTNPPKDGKVDLDFNKAYNPPCAYNPYTTCPLPSVGNRLPVEIPAGEKRYHE